MENSGDSEGNEDLSAFERRLMEIIAGFQPSTLRWRIVLTTMSLFTALSALFWIQDWRYAVAHRTKGTPLYKHPLFSLATLTLTIYIIYRMQNWQNDPTEIQNRIHSILNEFHLSCDQDGRLIVKDSGDEISEDDNN